MKLDVRLVALLVLLAASIYIITSPYLLKRYGVVVSSLADSRCTMKVGDVITAVSGHQIANKNDFYESVKRVKKGEYVAMVVNGGPGGCTALDDSQLGVEVIDIRSSQLMFGIDVQGGVVTLLKPETDVHKTAAILSRRAEVYNIPEFRMSVNDSVIRATALSEDVILPLLEKGMVEARVAEDVEIDSGIGYLPLGDRVYTVELVDKNVRINGIVHRVNDSFRLEDVDFTVRNVTNTSVVVEAKIFNNDDITRTLSSGTLQYSSDRRTYEFTIPVEISQEATDRFNKVLRNVPTYSAYGQTLVRGFLIYYIDEKPISQLSIPAEMTKQTIKQISIVGLSPSINEATATKLKVLAAVESGVLSTRVSIVGIEMYKPTMREFCISLASSFIVLYALATSICSSLRYKKLNAGLTALSLTLVVGVIVLGVVALVQQSFGAWVIDLQTVAGVMAFMSVSLVQLFLTSERLIRRKEFLISRKLSASKFIDFSAAILSFVLLFTPFKFFGLTFLIGFVLEFILVRPIYTEKL
jgi:hypothetical protein